MIHVVVRQGGILCAVVGRDTVVVEINSLTSISKDRIAKNCVVGSCCSVNHNAIAAVTTNEIARTCACATDCVIVSRGNIDAGIAIGDCSRAVGTGSDVVALNGIIVGRVCRKVDTFCCIS